MKLLENGAGRVVIEATPEQAAHMLRSTYHTDVWVGTELLNDVYVAASELGVDLGDEPESASSGDDVYATTFEI